MASTLLGSIIVTVTWRIKKSIVLREARLLYYEIIQLIKIFSMQLLHTPMQHWEYNN